MQMALNKLGRAWKGLLSQGNEALGIDGEFTRPGVEALLGKLADKVAESECECKFVWR